MKKKFWNVIYSILVISISLLTGIFVFVCLMSAPPCEKSALIKYAFEAAVISLTLPLMAGGNMIAVFHLWGKLKSERNNTEKVSTNYEKEHVKKFKEQESLSIETFVRAFSMEKNLTVQEIKELQDFLERY